MSQCRTRSNDVSWLAGYSILVIIRTSDAAALVWRELRCGLSLRNSRKHFAGAFTVFKTFRAWLCKANHGER
jgi:hypothetical protein